MRLDSVRLRLGFMGCLGVNVVGRKGGLALMWRNAEDAEILSYSQHHISARIEDTMENCSWVLTGFYGEPET